MEYWQRLHWLQKAILGLALALFLLFAPEFIPTAMTLIDVGGIELLFGFVILNAKYWISYLRNGYTSLQTHLAIFHHAALNSAISKPKNFITHAIFCSAVLLVTGSILFSVSFLLPVLMANGMLYWILLLMYYRILAAMALNLNSTLF